MRFRFIVGAATLAFGLGLAAPVTAHAVASVALILGVKGSPFANALACGALDAAQKRGLTIALFAPDHFTAESQVPVLYAVAARQPTIAIISPADGHGVTRTLKQMADRGTKLITVDPTINDPSFVASQVVTSNIEGGRMSAPAIIEAVGGRGPSW